MAIKNVVAKQQHTRPTTPKKTSDKKNLGQSLIQSLLRLAGLAWKVLDFRTVCRKQKTLQVQLPYRSIDGAK